MWLSRTNSVPYVWAGAITIVVALPWWAPGFLFGTDWPGPRFLRWPSEGSSTAPFEAILSLVSSVFSAEIAAKLLVIACLFVAGLSAYRAVPIGDFVPRAAGSLLYVLNPFVYGRLHYGQYALVAAYAVLPWVAMRVYRLLMTPSIVQALWLAAGFLIVGMLAVHLLLAIALLLGVSVIVALAIRLFGFRSLTRLGLSLAVFALVTIAISAYWLIPYLAGKTYESRVIANVGSGDLAAFSSVADPAAGLITNLLGLYGFWAEAVHRFPSMKLFVPYWNDVLLVMLVLAAAGVVSPFVAKDGQWRGLRWWVTALVVTGAVSLVLEAGVAEPHVAPVIRWLDSVFPPYRGMRDSGKWASMLAVVYAQLIPLGLMAIREAIKRWLKNPTLQQTSVAIVAAVSLGVPLYYGNGLLFGMHGEIRPSAYPAGWYAVDRVLARDLQHERALFLPWHLYLRLSFVGNVNSVIANPAPGFFSMPMVISGDPQVTGIPPPGTEDQRAVEALVHAGGAGDWGHVLASRHIKYVVLAKELDWENFRYLDQQAGLVRVADYGSVVLYRVMANN
jgi:hypothetical protein